MLYGVVDLARDPTGFLETGMAMHAPDAVCLYGEPIGDSVRRCAPFLTPLPPGSPFARFWRDNGWGSAWGIIIGSDSTLAGLRRHLRRFLTVTLPDGSAALFRFYDPRALPAYLRSCTQDELAAWFSAIQFIRAECPAPADAITFGFDGHRLIER